MELQFSGQFFEEHWNIKFHENPSSGGRVVPLGNGGRTDITMLVFAFRNFANAPNTITHRHAPLSIGWTERNWRNWPDRFVHQGDERSDRATVYVTATLLTYSLTHSLTHLLTHSLTHLPTYSLTHLPTYSLTHSLIHLLTYLLTHLLTYLLTYLTHSLT